MKEFHESGIGIEFVWHYEDDDDDMRESGEELFEFSNIDLPYKFNPYSKNGSFDIKLSNIDWKYINYTDLTFGLIYPLSSIKNYINSQMWISCIDSQLSNINCNSFLQWTYNLVNEPVKNTWNTVLPIQPIKTTENNQVISPINNITSEKDYSIYVSKTKSQVVKNLIISRTDLNNRSISPENIIIKPTKDKENLNTSRNSLVLIYLYYKNFIPNFFFFIHKKFPFWLIECSEFFRATKH